uniref:AMP-binding protein n=1 Tax=Rhodococcus phenolicus TaxID=263849 RepID=UPI0012E85B91
MMSTAVVRAIPVSGAQAGVWFGQQAIAEPAVYVVSHAWELRGTLDSEALVDAVSATLGEAHGLSARFGEQDGQVVQWLGAHDITAVPVYDLGSLPDPEAAAREHLADRRAIDPATDPCVAARVLLLAADHAIVVLTAHHIVLDAFGLGLLGRRAAERYSAAVRGDAAPDSWFGSVDAVVTEFEEYETSEKSTQDRDFWIGTLAGAPEAVTLSTATTAAGFAVRVRSHAHVLDPEATAALSALGRTARGTWGDALAALTAAFVAGWTGSREVVLEFPLMNRFGSAAMTVPTMAVNVVPLRVPVAADATAETVTAETVAAIRAAGAHGRYRGERIAREVRAESGATVSGPWLNIKPFGDELRFHGLDAQVHSLARGPVRDLSLTVRQTAGGAVELQFDADADRYSERDLQLLGSRLARFVESALSAGDAPIARTEMLLDTDIATVTELGAGAVRKLEPATLDDLLVRQARRTPEAPAVRFEDRTLTYREFDAAVDRFANHLRDHGVRAGDRVAVLLARSERLPLVLCATLRAGAAYVPVDTAYPADRIAYILEDAEPAAVVTDVTAADRAELLADLTVPVVAADTAAEAAAAGDTGTGAASVRADDRPLHHRDAAYLIYTSGSTGRPKGVVVSHEAIVNRLVWMQDTYPLTADDRVLQKTPSSFDVSVWEFFWPLITGATLVMARPDGHRDPQYLADVIADERITTLHFVPSMLAAFVESAPSPDRLATVRRIFCSGEALPAATARAATELVGDRVHNLYGPTEAAVDVTYHAYGPADDDRASVPIGLPVANTSVVV